MAKRKFKVGDRVFCTYQGFDVEGKIDAVAANGIYLFTTDFPIQLEYKGSRGATNSIGVCDAYLKSLNKITLNDECVATIKIPSEVKVTYGCAEIIVPVKKINEISKALKEL